MNKKIIIANWKMNPDSPGRAVLLAKKIETLIHPVKNLEVVIAPPTPFLLPVGAVLEKASLGAQNTFWEDVGPYTGETSWRQSRNLGVRYVIIGHSERRIFVGETDEMVGKKVRAVAENGMTAILCIGEHERNGDDIPSTVGVQLRSALQGMKKNFLRNVIVCYEPVWAISTTPGGRPDTPDNGFRAAMYIRKIIAGMFGLQAGRAIRVAYGGSVNAKNIAAFLGEGHMDGALVGGVSLIPGEFGDLLAAALV